MSDSRTEFEAAMIADWPDSRKTQDAPGHYVDLFVQMKWEGWQAAHHQPAIKDSFTTQPERVALSDAEIDEGLKLHRLPHGNHSQLADAFRAGARWASTQPVIAEVVATKMLPGFIQLTYSNGAIVKKLPLVDENGDEYMELQPNNPESFHATTPKDYFLYPQPVIAEAARDECIGVAQALEQSRAIMIAEAVTALQIGGATSDMPTPFQSGFQLACEEITYRLRTEMWDGCLLPIGVAITASKAKQ